ncbi:UDP-glucose/GDP-mannose dehydrogenase family protein [Chimaeribacter arupi]|uniref:UDP-glucose 6-dehydrogenase n=1 Tax=Chimaeribacter arupi TaxID=2060066 RepID=A0A2N5ESS3_9GAMM|nr:MULTISPECIES: UDP-glucose/GDP-mannose dehydrogenase family protein [Yersiniaceae]MDV5138940.1 UDP-glucose/GDP-mannose dehydrogenase family protein [Chimaeribacter arupi]PLR32915.1 UDP-glucose/GDP-mannose dehydrogenase family protein [Chimaeribacter arupi]PLR44867.1 UDP-glucose/GDP-mannose dehydrogenase family protein [Chimaeribacter arupi]PLR49379.1 UDP-glucose/GDP-mannose dehydrogenase family protein [Chimaeribacter arupi]PLR53157.1 UDP-glucose/GDP-mannose dehydrogenase family protein [Chi
MKVTVFGIGYVGLVQAAVLAEVGHDVLCVDVDERKVENLKKGIIPIYEPGLTPLVQQNYEAGRLQFTTNAEQGVAHGVMQFIAVGTPPDEDGSADLKYVTAVARTIAQHMTDRKVVIDKSTVPVGTADKVRAVMAETLKQRGAEIAYDVVSNPEFLKEGAAVADCMRPERIVIGTDNPEAIEPIRELYEPFNRNHDRMILMDVRSAELTKYAANCMLATKISFMNEIANLAEILGADIEKVRQGIGSDSRIGYHFIYPGCGYGGSCFPKDVQALIRTSEQIGYQPKLLQAVEHVNYQQKYKLTQFIKREFGDNLKGKTFALWGLSFKPNTDDMREASSRVLMETLWEAGAQVQAFDPEAMDETQRIYGHRDSLKLMGTKEAALQGADALVICTEWQNFRAPDFDVIKASLKQPVIFDGRNLFDPERLAKRGFTYYGIGRGASVQVHD